MFPMYKRLFTSRDNASIVCVIGSKHTIYNTKDGRFMVATSVVSLFFLKTCCFDTAFIVMYSSTLQQHNSVLPVLNGFKV